MKFSNVKSISFHDTSTKYGDARLYTMLKNEDLSLLNLEEMNTEFLKHTASFIRVTWFIDYTPLRRLFITSACTAVYSNNLLNKNVNESIESLQHRTLFN